jgi:hypothetical protein
MGKALARPNREFQSTLQIKEGYCPMLELFPDDTFSRQPETIPVEPKRSL